MSNTATESFPATIPSEGDAIELVTPNLEAAGFRTSPDGSKPEVTRLEEETDSSLLDKGYTHKLAGESFVLSAYDPILRVSYTLGVRDPRVMAYFINLPLFSVIRVRGVATKVTAPQPGHSTTTVNVSGRLEIVARGDGPTAKARIITVPRGSAAVVQQSVE